MTQTHIYTYIVRTRGKAIIGMALWNINISSNLKINSIDKYLPVVVKHIMAAAFCENAASTAAMAVVSKVSVGLGVSKRSSSNTTR